MNNETYYTPPSDAIFGDIKRAAIRVWKTYNDDYGYATGKIDRIKDIGNVKDNYAYMIAMFDYLNQQKLIRSLEREDSKALVAEVLHYSMYGG